MKFRRRQYINDPGYQITIVIVFVIITLFANIISIGVFNYLALQKMEDIIWRTHIDYKSTGEIINSLFIYLNIINICFITLMLILMGRWMIKKTTGPLMRMSRGIKRITEGNLVSDMTLKQNDAFQDVASEINNVRERMRDRFERISSQHHDISCSIIKLALMKDKRDILTEESGIIREKIKMLEEEMDKLQF